MLGNNYPYFNQEYYTPEEAIKILSKQAMYYHIMKAVKDNGLEGVEDMIKRNYKTVPKLRENMLKMLYLIWGK